MLIAHLSDLHLRDAGDAVWLDRQLDRIAARRPDHLAITGDLFDRWLPALLARVLDALGAHGFLDSERLTVLHGNHDLASSGGHPRRGADLWRMVLRFWDPPPLIALRRRRFYRQIAQRAPGVAAMAPFVKTLRSGLRISVIDTVPKVWLPFRIEKRTLVVSHAVGGIDPDQLRWLAAQHGPGPLVTLMHHYPLDTPPYQWTPAHPRAGFSGVRVPMHIRRADRARFWEAATAAGTRLVLCGHVHRMRLEWREGIAIGLNGQSGAAWAGRPIAYYEITDDGDVSTDIDRME